jgi:hypothetical protein
MSVDSLAKIFEGIFAMQTTRLNHRQNAFDKTAARHAIATKAAPTPPLGHEVLGTCDALGRQQLFEARRMVRLRAAATCGLFLVNRLVGAERVGGWRRRRVAGVGVELGKQFAHPRFEFRNAAEKFLTSWTRWHGHAE